MKKNHIPVIYNFPIGHGKKNFVVPVGNRVTLDTYRKVLYST